MWWPAFHLRFCTRQVTPNSKVFSCFQLKPRRRVLHDACPTTESLHRLFSENNIDGGLCVVSDSPQVTRVCCRRSFDVFKLLIRVLERCSAGYGVLQRWKSGLSMFWDSLQRWRLYAMVATTCLKQYSRVPRQPTRSCRL